MSQWYTLTEKETEEILKACRQALEYKSSLARETIKKMNLSPPKAYVVAALLKNIDKELLKS